MVDSESPITNNTTLRKGSTTGNWDTELEVLLSKVLLIEAGNTLEIKTREFTSEPGSNNGALNGI